LFDEDIAIQLKDAGCKWVDFGIQHINEEYRNKYLKRNETNAEIRKALQILKNIELFPLPIILSECPETL